MKNICAFLLLCFSGSVAFGQAGHYWTESFGTKSMLLNGTVIGSVQDLGAVYYNPARISQMESPAFVISGQVYRYNQIRVEDGLGDGIDLSRNDFGGGPSLVSGTFTLPFLKGHKFAYAFLTRSKFDNSFGFGIDEFGDYVRAFPGDEYFSGEITTTNKLTDEWIGLSWSYAFDSKWSVGISGFYSHMQRDANLKVQLQGYSPITSTTGMYIEKRGYGFTSQSLIAKLGLGFKKDKYSLGLTVTTPKFQGIGKGSTNYETFLAGIDTTGDGNTDDIYIIDAQNDLSIDHRSPWSVGLGGGFNIGRSLFHLSTEWFSEVPLYAILQSEPFTAQSTGEVIQQTVVANLESVWNFGLGYELFINDKLLFFGSVATDFSATPSEVDRLANLDDVINNITFRADIMHYGFGFDIKTKFADLTIGATYSNARENILRNLEIDEGNDNVTTDAVLIYRRWQFLIGFSFPFLDKAKDQLVDQ